MIIWYHNTDAPIDAARIAANSGEITHVMFRVRHPRHQTFWRLVDRAMEFRTNCFESVIVAQDLWPEDENRSAYFTDPVVMEECLSVRFQHPDIETAIDCEPYNSNLKRLVNMRVDRGTMMRMFTAISLIQPFDYSTPAVACKLAYGSVKSGDIYRMFPLLGRRRIRQQTYYRTITDPDKWLSIDPTDILGLSVSDVEDGICYSPAEAIAVYPGWDKMIYPVAGKELEVAKRL